MKKTFFFILRVAISCFFIGLLYWLMRGNIPNLIRVLKATDIKLFITATAIYLAVTFLFAQRLRVIMAGQGISFTLIKAAQLIFIGFFFNNFLPTAIGGDLVKAYYAGKHSGNRLGAFSSIFVDRVLGFLPLATMAVLAIWFGKNYIENVSVFWMVLIFMLLLGGGVAFFVLPAGEKLSMWLLKPFSRMHTLTERCKRTYAAISGYRAKKKLVLHAFTLSFIAQTIIISVIYLLAISLGATTPLVQFFWAVPLVFTLSMMPSLNGLGIREGAFVYFFHASMGKEGAMALALLWLALYYIGSIIGGIIYLFMRKDVQAVL